MADAGLHCVSAHYSSGPPLRRRIDDIIAFHKVLGAPYIVCSYPGHKTKPAAGGEHSFTLEDWHWNAEQFNHFGAKVKAAGFHFGYHNHTPEFVAVDGVTPYDELMKLTDPALVTFEMDCGWVMVGGGDPVTLLHKYPNRISLLHVKDFQKPAQPFSPSHEPVRDGAGPRQASTTGRSLRRRRRARSSTTSWSRSSSTFRGKRRYGLTLII